MSWWSTLFHPDRRRLRLSPLPVALASPEEMEEDDKELVPPVELPVAERSDKEVVREREPPILGLSTLSMTAESRVRACVARPELRSNR